MGWTHRARLACDDLIVEGNGELVGPRGGERYHCVRGATRAAARGDVGTARVRRCKPPDLQGMAGPRAAPLCDRIRVRRTGVEAMCRTNRPEVLDSASYRELKMQAPRHVRCKRLCSPGRGNGAVRPGAR